MEEFEISSEGEYNYFLSLLNNKQIEVIQDTPMVIKMGERSIKLDIKSEFIDQYKLNKIIYGKDTTPGITNISVLKDTVYIFQDNKTTTLPYKQWVLANKFFEGFSRLKGSQHYNYIREFDMEEFDQVRDGVYKNRMYTLANKAEAFMIKNGHTYFKGLKTTDISVLSFDIETTGLDPYAIDACVLVITNVFRKNNITEKKTFCIEDYETQQDMIFDWTEWVRDKDPVALLGHNIIIYDIPYIKAQMDKKDYPLRLGKMLQPVEVEDKVRELRVDGSQTYSYKRINIFGREVIDTFFLAIKADIGRKYESYALKKIIEQEKLEKPNRQHYDAGNIAKQWHNPEERKKIIAYAEDDAEDPIKLFDLMIAPFFYLTPHIPKTFQMMIESATGSQINSLIVRSYLQEGHSVAKSDDIDGFEGAISFGNVGIYDNVMKVDVASLYPSIMRYYKIFPKGKDYNGNFLKALNYFTEERLKNKALATTTGDRYYKDLEQAQKVVINSAYGFMGAKGLNYNYGHGASLVTKYGREIITKAVEWACGNTLKKVIKHIVNEGKPNQEIEYEWVLGDKIKQGQGYSIVNCDTDSISFTCGKLLTEEERNAIVANINEQYPKEIYFADDGFFHRVIVLKAKNYILWDGTKIKLKGSSLKDKKREPAIKEMTDKMINCLIHREQDLLSIYHDYIKECLNVKDITRWATKKTMSKAILNCATNPDARLNERKVYNAVRDIPVQEGDKVYLYPAILSEQREETPLKNGKLRVKVIKEQGLKRIDQWTNDHDVDKLIDRVCSSVELLKGVNDTNFIDYTLVKNKILLDNLK